MSYTDKKMKAWVLHDINDFKKEEIDVPVIGEGEVLVNVKACGICGSDIPRVYETGAHVKPLVIGHEFAGKVVATGENVSDSWKNKSVGIFPLIPCGKCMPCKKKQYEMCRNYSYLGSRCNGGFAEYVAVPEWNLIELSDSVSYEEAAMLEPMAVAVHSMRRALLASDLCTIESGNEQYTATEETTIAVLGLGTIGLLLTMFLKQAGYKNIYVIGNKDFQHKKALELGIEGDNYCDGKTLDVTEWLMAKTDGFGVDIFFECVGKNETLSQAISCTAPAGTAMLVGNPYSDMQLDKNTYWKILRNQLTVLGTWNSSYTHDEADDWHYVVKCLENKCIEPSKLISHRFDIDDIEAGFHIMRDKSEDYVKVMCKL